jgi:hypothetical protein
MTPDGKRSVRNLIEAPACATLVSSSCQFTKLFRPDFFILPKMLEGRPPDTKRPFASKENAMGKVLVRSVFFSLATGHVPGGCAAPQIPTSSASPAITAAPVTPAPSAIKASPKVTRITIDGKAGDWADRPVANIDPAGNGEKGYLDLPRGTFS